MAEIRLSQINKKLSEQKDNYALTEKEEGFRINNLSLLIPDGKTTVILGPSGCGKTTLLRLIGGLTSPDSGEIYYQDRLMNDVPARERKIGMLFQNFGLYPHFNARKNILSWFLLNKEAKALKEIPEEKLRETSRLLEVDMEYLLNRNPKALSGGEKQRVAMGRCITRDPELFLMDEPFSNMDARLRQKYRVRLKKLITHFSITTVYVTHDHQEAALLADRIALMKNGVIVQTGTWKDLYYKPADLFTAGFLNFSPETPALYFWKDLQPGSITAVRPENIRLLPESKSGGLEGIIERMLPDPSSDKTMITLSFRDQDILFPSSDTLGLEPGKKTCFGFTEILNFSSDTEKLISDPQGNCPGLIKKDI